MSPYKKLDSKGTSSSGAGRPSEDGLMPAAALGRGQNPSSSGSGGGIAGHGRGSEYSQAVAGCPTFVGLRSGKMTGEDLGRVRRFLEDKVPLDGSVVPQIL